jgi:cytochrome c oxidase cbb3-type subunit 2
VVQDIFRTMTTGLSGTPMPSYQQSLPEEDRWALAYFVLALSAFKDPLTGEPLNIPPEARAALNDTGLDASSSERAYAHGSTESATQQANFGGDAWAERNGMENVDTAADGALAAAAAEQ